MLSTRVTNTQMIPKIIHQTWKTASVPQHLIGYVETWTRHHPEWEYRLWTDEDNLQLVREHYPQYMLLYQHFHSGIQRADLARCLILHHCGGLYVDLDFECVRPIDSLLSSEDSGVPIRFLAGTEPVVHSDQVYGSKNIVCNALMASVPGLPLWTHVAETIKYRTMHSQSFKGVLETTGPGVLTSCLSVMADETYVIAPPDVFYPKVASKFRQHAYDPSQVYAIHHWDNGWIRK